MLKKIKSSVQETSPAMKSNFLDHVLFFLTGALNPVFLIIGMTTTWVEMARPLIVLGMVYGGAMNVVALRKQLYGTLKNVEMDNVEIPNWVNTKVNTKNVGKKSED